MFSRDFLSAAAVVPCVALSACGAAVPIGTTAPLALLPTTRTVDVTWSAPYLAGGAAFGTAGTLSLGAPYVASVARWLAALPRLDAGNAAQGACAYALFYGSGPVFTFHTNAGTVVFAYQDCYRVTVTINGKPQPTREASSPSLPDSEQFMRQALHVQPPAAPD